MHDFFQFLCCVSRRVNRLVFALRWGECCHLSLRRCGTGSIPQTNSVWPLSLRFLRFVRRAYGAVIARDERGMRLWRAYGSVIARDGCGMRLWRAFRAIIARDGGGKSAQEEGAEFGRAGG